VIHLPRGPNSLRSQRSDRTGRVERSATLGVSSATLDDRDVAAGLEDRRRRGGGEEDGEDGEGELHSDGGMKVLGGSSTGGGMSSSERNW
jgi:hypothetical protein